MYCKYTNISYAFVCVCVLRICKITHESSDCNDWHQVTPHQHCNLPKRFHVSPFLLNVLDYQVITIDSLIDHYVISQTFCPDPKGILKVVGNSSQS